MRATALVSCLFGIACPGPRWQVKALRPTAERCRPDLFGAGRQRREPGPHFVPLTVPGTRGRCFPLAQMRLGHQTKLGAGLRKSELVNLRMFAQLPLKSLQGRKSPKMLEINLQYFVIFQGLGVEDFFP